jgi:hypothetical protein
LIEQSEGVRERVREQARSSMRGRHRGLGRRRRRSRAGGYVDRDADVEAELERDEACEGIGEASVRTPGVPAEARATESQPRAAELFPDILGWQPLVLNRDFECGRCKRNLAAGESAFLGLGEKGLTQTALCGRCAGSR